MIFPFCRKIRLKNQFSYGTNGLVTCFEQLGVEALKNALMRGWCERISMVSLSSLLCISKWPG